MKKMLYSVVLCCAFAACDKTENEQAIEYLFIGSNDGKTSLYDYNTATPDGVIYSEEFNDPNNCDGWTLGTDEYATRAVENGQYFIQAKKNFCSWRNFDADNSRDFQVEVLMSCNFLQGGTDLGIVFGVNQSAKTYGAMFFEEDSKDLYLGFYNGSKWAAWYTDKNAPYAETAYRNASHLYTLRKVDNTLYFFLDRKYLFSRNCFDVITLNNIGFYLTKSGIIWVDNVKAEYLK